MKKLILLIVVSTFSFFSIGQVKIAIGAKGGLNFSKLDIDNFSTSGKTGYHLGAFALFRFKKIGLQPELIFSEQGSEANVNDWDTKYINIPLILKFYLPANFNLQAGPQFGFLNSAELENGTDIKDKLKSSDISLGLGLGWEAPFGLTFDARYNLGVSDNSDDPAYETIKSQVFQISAGFKIFKFGK
jgi:hypothetical protein